MESCSKKHLDDRLQFHDIAPRGIYSEFEYTISATQQIVKHDNENETILFEFGKFETLAIIALNLTHLNRILDTFSYHFQLNSLVFFKNNSTIILKTRRHATTDFGKERKYGGTTYTTRMLAACQYV